MIPRLAALSDFRFAFKSLLRSPGLTVVAIITLGLGIGANASMFSILNAYMLRPAAYPERERIDRIYRATRQDPRGGFSPADYLDLKSQAGGFGDIAAYTGSDMTLSEAGKQAETAVGLRASTNLFPILGTQPRMGRGFRSDEEIAGNHRVLVISHRYWQNRFGGDPLIIGRAVRVDGEPYEIVGVLPADFSDWRHLSFIDVYRPLALSERETRDRESAKIRLVGRRASGVSPAQGAAFIAGFGRRLATEHPAADAETTWRTVPIDRSFLPDDGRQIMAMLVGLSGFVLLIACSNLANLLLARTMARAREFAVRSALGATRLQMLRPLFAESLLLAFAGGFVAILVAMWTYDWFAMVSAGDNGVGVDIRLDWRVLAWMFGVSLFTALAFGVVPALFALRLDPNRTLKSGGRSSTTDRGHRRFRNVLIAGQFALAMVLLAGAALFTRGLHQLNNRRAGWESDGLITGTVVLPVTQYSDAGKITDFQRRALERLEALPGVVSASMSYAMPYFGLSEPRRWLVAGHDTPEPGHEPVAVINGVTPHYFETVGTRLVGGRGFDDRDTPTSPRVFIINQAMARGLFGEENPIGRRIAQAGVTTQAGAPAPEWGEIVGIASDVQSVSPDRTRGTEYQLYLPMTQETRPLGEIAVRTSGSAPAALVASIRQAIAAIDADLLVRKLQPATTTIARANYQEGVLASVLSALAAIGLGLASLGIYGVIARTVAQRTGEFGIRLALGAQPGDITRLVLGSGVKLALIGSAVGLVGAFGVGRLLTASFPGVQTSSLPIMAGATVLLIVIAQIAGYLPARRASRISPTEALRAE